MTAAMNRMLLDGRALLDAARAHALEEWPKESVGAVMREGNLARYQKLQNVAVEPTEHFDCARELSPLLMTERVIGLIHSHPKGYEGPSAADMLHQAAMDIPWGIVVTDGTQAADPWFWGDALELNIPLDGRRFRHGPTGTDGKGDCYALVRDWFQINRGVTLPDFPRDDNWWTRGGNLYLDGFRQAGFEVVLPTETQSGDVAFFSPPIHTPGMSPEAAALARANRPPYHAGVLIAGGQILHHLPNRLSRAEPLAPWVRFARLYVRHAASHPR